VLDAWLRLGLVGLLLLAGLWGRTLQLGLRAYRRLRDGPMRALVLGLLGGLVSALAHGMVDHAFFLVDLAFTLALQAALIQAIGVWATEHEPEPHSS
jgi:hypothetical protein